MNRRLNRTLAVLIGVSTSVANASRSDTAQLPHDDFSPGGHVWQGQAAKLEVLDQIEQWMATGATPSDVINYVQHQSGVNLRLPEERTAMQDLVRTYKHLTNIHPYSGQNVHIDDGLDDEIIFESLKDSIINADAITLEAMNAAIMIIEMK